MLCAANDSMRSRNAACPHLWMATQSLHTRVLIADDHADAAETLSALLQLISPTPMVIFVAFDGLQALRMATRAPYPDAVILDITMGLHSSEDARRGRTARAEAIRKGIEPPKVVFTGR